MADNKHLGGYKYRNRRDRRDKRNPGRNSVWGTIITATAGIIIKDLTNENSMIKKLFNKIIYPKRIEDNQNEKKIIDVEYSIENNDNNK